MKNDQLDSNTAANMNDKPVFSVLAQYTKDLSFENPKIVQSIIQQPSAPSIDVNVQVQTNRLNEEHFEVELQITAKAMRDNDTDFLVELSYGGLFYVSSTIHENNLKPLILIEAPRLLFPFAREIIADATQRGGLPPLLLQPLDFQKLYEKNPK